MIATTPQDFTNPTPDQARDDDPAEHFAGYTLMGQPFASGHYLAMRRWHYSSIGPGYRAVWLRRPDGRWTIYADAPPQQSCARYFGAALDDAVTTTIGLNWTGPNHLRVVVPGILDWSVRLAATPATAMAGFLSRRVPAPLWQEDAFLAGMGHMVGPMLRIGRVQLAGQVPNGQSFRNRPLRIWAVAENRATIMGEDPGPPKPLDEQARLGDLWMPQRGIFAADVAVRFPSTAEAGSGSDAGNHTRGGHHATGSH